jgi:hypothetical protein
MDLLERLAKVDGNAYHRRPEVLALVPRLEPLLDGSPDRAMEAAWALIYVGPPASRAVPKILKAVARFAEAAGEGRRMVAMIVVYIPGWGEPGIRALSGALDDRDERVWRSALVVLTNPGVVTAENVGLFTPLLGHHRAEVRKDVVMALGREGNRLRHVVPKVEPLLRDRDAEVRRAAQFAIEQLKGVRNRRGDLIGARGALWSPLPQGGEGGCRATFVG